MKALVMALFAVLCLVSCTTTKQYVPTGGSRADGMVALSYEYGLFEKPQADEEQAVTMAASSCSVWGYTGASPFGKTQQCLAFNGYGSCIRWQITQRYQCTGAPSLVNAPVQTAAPSSAPASKATVPVSATAPAHQI
jgi:hypothetical protein